MSHERDPGPAIYMLSEAEAEAWRQAGPARRRYLELLTNQRAHMLAVSIGRTAWIIKDSHGRIYCRAEMHHSMLAPWREPTADEDHAEASDDRSDAGERPCRCSD